MSQSQIKLMAIASILLIVFAGAFLFRNEITKQINRKPVGNQNDLKKKLETKPRDITFPTNDILVQSGIARYQITLQHEDFLVKTLEEVFIFGRQYVTNYKSTTGINPMNNIHLLIRDKIEPAEPDYGDFTYVYLRNGLMQVNIVLKPEQLNEKGIEDVILRTFLGAVYKTVYINEKNSKIEAEADKLFDKLKDENTDYLVIEKL